MTGEKTDTLVKPDMRAVLSRTHLGKDMQGFLLPVFEAISNSMHGIETRFGEAAQSKGKIHIAFKNSTDPSKILISITDNGIGLNDENYQSFKTPFSGHKLKQNGRGFGRFIAFKVFSRILYSSRYEFFATQNKRTFRFDINQDQEIIMFDGEPDFLDVGMCVEYDQPRSDWHELIRELNVDVVADEIGSHFLPYFLYKWLPEITIQFDDHASQSITSHFKDLFVQSDAGEIECDVDGKQETLKYAITRVPRTRSFKNHCLLLSAADRIVGSPRDLTNKIGQPYFLDGNNGKYIIIAVVRSDAFESRLNDARTGINVSPKTIESIVSMVSDVIQSKEKDQIDKIKKDQSVDLDKALKENPILRLGLKGKAISEYVSSKPNNWTAEQFVSDLAIERYRATNDLTRAIVEASSNSENYEKTLKELVGKIDESKKEALAEYVIHRKNIISLVESARKFGRNGERSPEDAIHDLVFRRFSDNAALDYFEHNLWLIDDALAFLPYVSSDRTLHGGSRKKGDKISDLAFFDDSLLLGDNDGTTITIVEFKKPSRDDYAFGNAKSDPVLQVLETLTQATQAGGISKTDGSHFSFVGTVRRFAFIIADITPTLVRVLGMHDFKNSWNPRIYVRYRDNEEIFIQVFGYDTLVENAKKRNQAFFSVLLEE